MIFFWAHKCDKSMQSKSSNVNSETYNNPSNNFEIATCPKCGKSYNKATWGEMCNTCWNEGKGLKSNGKYIVE